eukprot:TRINITY_DN36608_c0_g1_i1.p1 TRINITY_DN36608_c0_g1~~TRINITY_DN36608_c0_g1_i1.p1  ORF type:complete len:221 (+),score=22.32 TRINITY_DN36608_c0_g1_i1:37-663(+)
MGMLLNFIEWHFFLELRKKAMAFSPGRWEIITWSQSGQTMPSGSASEHLLVSDIVRSAGGTDSIVIQIAGRLSRPSGFLCWMGEDLPPPRPRPITAAEAQRIRAGKSPSFKARAVTHAPSPSQGMKSTHPPPPPPRTLPPLKTGKQSESTTTYMYDIPVDPPAYEDALLLASTEDGTTTDMTTTKTSDTSASSDSASSSDDSSNSSSS